MEVATGQLLVARLHRWDAVRLTQDAETDRRLRLAEGETNPDYSVSVFGMVKEAGEDVEKLMRRLCEHITTVPRRSNWVTFTTDARLLTVGYELRASTPPEHHFDVILGTNLTSERVAGLEAVFNEESRRRFPSCELP